MKNIGYLLLLLIICSFGCRHSDEKLSKDNNYSIKNAEAPILVAIAPYHDISNDLVELVSKEVEDFYGIKTIILKKAPMPDSCMRPYKKRYNANKILEYLAEIKPTNIPFILALTTKGIATKTDKYKEWGILGLGSRPGPVCIISTANMGKDNARLKNRLVKVSLHEMGHNFGLPHCEYGDTRCLMRSAKGTVRTVDEEEKYLCKYCSGFLMNKGFHLHKKS